MQEGLEDLKAKLSQIHLETSSVGGERVSYDQLSKVLVIMVNYGLLLVV